MSNDSTYKGVFIAKKKNGDIYYRSSVNFKGKHISLGSFDDKLKAHSAYLEAKGILGNKEWDLANWNKSYALSFCKCVVLLNFRENNVYIATPILLRKNFFLYYISNTDVLTFDIDDLFYYSSHSIMRRGNHLFVADYGSQLNIMHRYGIGSYAVAGRDYKFINGDKNDLRYQNIEIINRYRGVRCINVKGFTKYKAVIHINGDFVVGKYNSEIEAAIAYNKAIDVTIKRGIHKNFEQNYIEDISPKEYADIYSKIKISKKLYSFLA